MISTPLSDPPSGRLILLGARYLQKAAIGFIELRIQPALKLHIWVCGTDNSRVSLLPPCKFASNISELFSLTLTTSYLYFCESKWNRWAIRPCDDSASEGGWKDFTQTKDPPFQSNADVFFGSFRTLCNRIRDLPINKDLLNCVESERNVESTQMT